MSSWETSGRSDEWYTPAFIFDALAVTFDLDVAAPEGGPLHVPCRRWIDKTQDGLKCDWWQGFVWMNPPFGGRNSLAPWLDKFFRHGNGIALTPDRTSAPWWQDAASSADAMLLTRGKIKFLRPDGSVGRSPGAGVTLWASGAEGCAALMRAEVQLGSVWRRAGFKQRAAA